MKKEKNDIKRNGKVREFIWIIIIIILVIMLISSNNSLSKTEIVFEDYTIGYNDNLWNIATLVKENNLNYNKKDVREIVYELKKINNLNNSDVYSNQVIKIPEI